MLCALYTDVAGRAQVARRRTDPVRVSLLDDLAVASDVVQREVDVEVNVTRIVVAGSTLRGVTARAILSIDVIEIALPATERVLPTASFDVIGTRVASKLVRLVISFESIDPFTTLHIVDVWAASAGVSSASQVDHIVPLMTERVIVGFALCAPAQRSRRRRAGRRPSPSRWILASRPASLPARPQAFKFGLNLFELRRIIGAAVLTN